MPEKKAARSEGREHRYQGIGTSKGIAIGEAYEFVIETIEHEIQELSAATIEKEVERFHTALRRSEKELRKIERVTTRKIGKVYSDLFQAQIMLLNDPALTGTIAKRIEAELKPAHQVIEQEFEKYLEHFINSEDLVFRERAADLHDIKDRIIRNLHIRKRHSWVPEGVIVVANHLSPGDIILLSRSNVKGFATDTGGKTSHISLLCKSLNLPIVVGLGNFTQKVTSGMRLVVDGYDGIVVAEPSAASVAAFHEKREAITRKEAGEAALAHQQARTRCGVSISMYANLDFVEELGAVASNGAEGVGLFRSENLFLDRARPPKESEQLTCYRTMADALAPQPLVIRLFDIGGDKLIYSPVREPNPNLGWRGVRILVDVPEILNTQLQAIIRANTHGNIDILMPMISSLEEIAFIKAAIDRNLQALCDETGETIDRPGIGAMIEIPAAVELIDEITRVVDFVSIGTNDLTQYTLAVDRNNLIVQDLFEKFHPSIIRQLFRIISTAQKNRCRVSLCGDMGSDPLALPFLIGCGLRDFSVVSSDIPSIKSLIARHTIEETEKLASECLRLGNAEKIRACLEAFSRSH